MTNSSEHTDVLLKEMRGLRVFLTNDHFTLRSGKCTDTYINADVLYQRTDITSNVCRVLAKMLIEAVRPIKIDTILAPAMGGIPLSQWLTRHVHQQQAHLALATYAIKQRGDLIIEPTYHRAIARRNVAIADDVLTTGGSMKKLIQAVNDLGGNVIACASLFQRGDVTAKDLEVPTLVSLFNVPQRHYMPDNCPLCEQDIPVNPLNQHTTIHDTRPPLLRSVPAKRKAPPFPPPKQTAYDP